MTHGSAGQRRFLALARVDTGRDKERSGNVAGVASALTALAKSAGNRIGRVVGLT